MEYADKIRKKMKTTGGIITSREVKEDNIPTVYLSRMVERGELIRADRGIYIDSNGDFDEYYFLQKRYKVAIFSYVSALYLHRYTDIIPEEIEVTVYKGYNPHRIKGNVKVHYVTKAFYDLGATESKTMFGNTVRVYNLERVICDFIKNRNEIESELFSKTINRYVRDVNKDLKKLNEYSKKMRIQEKVKDILEVVYE